MPKIVTVEQMRAVEQAADAKGHTYAAMMEHAGAAVAERVLELVEGNPEPRIAILVGPGNNGGDGLVAGRRLLEALPRAQVGAFLLKPRDDSDDVFVRAREAGVFIADADNDRAAGYRGLQQLVSSADVLIDALFGTSLRLPIKGEPAKVLQAAHKALALRRADRPQRPFVTPARPSEGDTSRPAGPVVVAVDCPSGLDCDTGALDPNALHADETVTLAAAKPGLFVLPGAEAVGLLHIAAIGLPARLPELDDIPFTLVDAAEVARRLPSRPIGSHKGTFGKALIVAGSLNYVGAAYLSGDAAYRSGAGLVTVAAPQIIVPVLAGMLPEATWLLLPHDMGVINAAAVRVLRDELAGCQALLIGPGLGREDVTAEFLRELLQPKEELRRSRAIGFVPVTGADAERSSNGAPLPPLVIDADGLNLLAGMDDWTALVPAHTVLTPHPGEFARLSGLDVAEVQAGRVALAREKAAAWNCVVVLKGAFTVVAAPDGRCALQPFATSALATAGTGDVLAGTIAGLLAQGLEPFDAALAAGWVHGMAGLLAADAFDTPISVMAGDVAALLPEAFALADEARAAAVGKS